MCQQRDLENIPSILGFDLVEQIKKQCRQSRFLKYLRNMLVSRTQPTASTPVRKEHDSMSTLGDRQDPRQVRGTNFGMGCL
jgi:hypothetical protein